MLGGQSSLEAGFGVAVVATILAFAALVLVEIAVNIVGDGVRDVVEQRLIRR
ncbi:MAG TPA: hypothetical protein VKV21_17915 [Solirubrobacteraceae bacterium]|nr:hypothetical protein [Solirubrobacteraceae bacterium]